MYVNGSDCGLAANWRSKSPAGARLHSIRGHTPRPASGHQALAMRGEVIGGNHGIRNAEQSHSFSSDLDLLYHLHLQSGVENLQLQIAGFSRLILKITGFAG